MVMKMVLWKPAIGLNKKTKPPEQATMLDVVD